MSERYYNSTGTLHYAKGGSHNLRVVIDPDIMWYYRSLIPKWWSKTNVPMYAPHISVVRKETPVNLEHWGKYQDEEVEFLYSHQIKFGSLFYWLDVYSPRLEEIRAELGLPVHSPYTLPPEGFKHCFHTTIANLKGLQ